MQKFSEVRNTLAVNHIEYDYKVVDLESTNIARSIRPITGSFGVNPEYTNTYYVYVHKKDYDKACAVLNLIY